MEPNIILKKIVISNISILDNRFDNILEKVNNLYELGEIDKSYKLLIEYIEKTNFRFRKPFLLLSKLVKEKGDLELSKSYLLIYEGISHFEDGLINDIELLEKIKLLKNIPDNLCKLFYVYTLEINGKFEKALEFIQKIGKNIEEENKINYYYLQYLLNINVNKFETAFGFYEKIETEDFLSKKYVIIGYIESYLKNNEINEKGLKLLLNYFKYEDEVFKINSKTKKKDICGHSFHTLLCAYSSIFLQSLGNYTDSLAVLLYGLSILKTDKKLKKLLVLGLKNKSIDLSLRKEFTLKLKEF